jgi:hypothetical protein
VFSVRVAHKEVRVDAVCKGGRQRTYGSVFLPDGAWKIRSKEVARQRCRGTPPRVFCAKSVEVIDGKGVRGLHSAKEFIRV